MTPRRRMSAVRLGLLALGVACARSTVGCETASKPGEAPDAYATDTGLGAAECWDLEKSGIDVLRRIGGPTIALALDPLGHAHFLDDDYGYEPDYPAGLKPAGNKLRYTTNASGVWTEGAVGPGVAGDHCLWPSLTIDAASVLHAVMSCGWYPTDKTVPPRFVHARNDGSGWTTDVIAELPIGPTAVAVDASGTVHVAFVSGLTTIGHASSSGGGAWKTETVWSLDECWNCPIGMAVNPSGEVHVAFQDPKKGQLLHAAQKGGGWAVDVVGAHPKKSSPTGAAITIDAAGHVHAAYSFTYDATVGGGLVYATNVAGAFSAKTIDSGEFASWDANDLSLALDRTSGSLHLGYVRDASLFHATNEGGAWTVARVSTPEVRSKALAMDPKTGSVVLGYPHLVRYFDAGLGDDSGFSNWFQLALARRPPSGGVADVGTGACGP